MASHSILADIARQVAGEEFQIDSIIPDGIDSHSYQPTPQDAARILSADVLILNGLGMEPFLKSILAEVKPTTLIIIATDGIESRKPVSSGSTIVTEPDPHFWMDPIFVKHAAKNIESGFEKIDPKNKSTFAENLNGFDVQLDTLDQWIKDSLSTVPIEKRLIVTNHETLGYFADRYGFTIAGTVLEGSSSDSSVSSKHIQELVTLIKDRGIPVMFIEPTDDVKIAEQVAAESGIILETGLITHGLILNGISMDYIGMMKHNVELIANLGK